MKEHYHCKICIKSHDTIALSEECFNSHSEIEKLRWIANSVNNIRIWTEDKEKLNELDYDLFNKIEVICEEFNISKINLP
ncbi:hypothetical protein [Romboutsia sp.]|uniref:hypothetical protein n=1 Tax=Romboutsia sp. TaxID=1965302 RepID=UPI003F3B019C